MAKQEVEFFDVKTKKKFKTGNCRFLTKRLWGAANQPPFFHHGRFTTLRRSVLAHDGEGKASRQAFQALPAETRDAVIEFLKSLQVLPPGTKDRIVDEHYQARTWPPIPLVSREPPTAPRTARTTAQVERREP